MSSVLTVWLLVPVASKGPGRRNHGMQGPNGLKSHEPPTDENYFIVDFVTTAGNFSLEVNPSWSPLGADHFLQMARDGYYNNQKVFRVIPNFLVQFGCAAVCNSVSALHLIFVGNASF